MIRGGPGSADPGLASFSKIDLFSLVAMSYGVQRHQVVGPEWMKSGTSVADYRVMLHGLLAERFKLALHLTALNEVVESCVRQYEICASSIIRTID